MIRQLVNDLSANGGAGVVGSMPIDVAALKVLTADPLDLLLYMEQIWDTFNPWAPNPPPAGRARNTLYKTGLFADVIATASPAWDHLGYSYVLENTRAVQILRRVVREYRSGENLGAPSVSTQRWLDATEALLFGAANPIAPWLSTSVVRKDPEEVRRNAYDRLMGVQLAFGTEDNRPATYDKAAATNTGFVRLFEELLYELWQAMINVKNLVGVNNSDNDRIFRITEELQFALRSRRQSQMLAREELAAATALGWVELTLSANTPVVIDLKAIATSPANRLKLIGERVGLAAHSKSAALFSMCNELSRFLRVIESNAISGPSAVPVLYTSATDIGDASRRVITEWAAATGKDLKARDKPVEVGRPKLVSVR
ncbi:hypothetical protein [Lysobacter sp. CFH 32150]|uniref:hypothetical protein n=1 Tax=Lysobacter sp. CFH 32150 TaxID=2927128 RepID=UPI001FA774DA|nr:hypothetical protein [Lysobacter sp. CFH 32150]MCI4568155.1 hypothetical protein [Lysobacter sp. CFH 32150]